MLTYADAGLDSRLVQIEVDISFPGMPHVTIVGHESHWRRMVRQDVRHPARIGIYTNSHAHVMLREPRCPIRSLR